MAWPNGRPKMPNEIVLLIKQNYSPLRQLHSHCSLAPQSAAEHCRPSVKYCRKLFAGNRWKKWNYLQLFAYLMRLRHLRTTIVSSASSAGSVTCFLGFYNFLVDAVTAILSVSLVREIQTRWIDAAIRSDDWLLTKQEAELSQIDRAMLRVVEYVAKSLKIIRNDTF